MNKVKCLLTYHQSKVEALATFAIGVRDGIYGHAVEFATPPITQVNFQTKVTDYQNMRGAYEQGGLAQKGPYLAARETLMNDLDTLAEYVDSVADGNANLILLSGFVPSKGSRSGSTVPDAPTGLVVKNAAASGVIVAECENQEGVLNYGCIVTVDAPLSGNVEINEGGQLEITYVAPTTSEGSSTLSTTGGAIGYIDLNPSRRKTFKNLKTGHMHYFVFYAANSAGVSSLSISVGIMCA